MECIKKSRDGVIADATTPPELCERARRVMCVYCGLASDVLQQAWDSPQTYKGPAAIVRGAAAWEPWVTVWEVRIRCSRPHQLLHARNMCNLAQLEIGSGPPRVMLPFSIADALGGPQRLQRLRVSGLHAEHADRLPDAFTQLVHLRELDVNVDTVGVDTAAELSRCLSHMGALTRLRMADARLGVDGMRALEPAFQHLSQLQELSLPNSRFGPGGAASLARALAFTPALKRLDVTFNSLEAAGVSALEYGFAHLGKLEELLIMHNMLDPAGAAALARCLRHTPRLLHLNMQSTGCNAEVLRALEPGFQHLAGLQHLDVSMCALGADGAAALRDCLLHTRALTFLGMELAQLTCSAMQSLEPALALPQLKQLRITNNSFASRGATSLARALIHAPSLSYVAAVGTRMTMRDKAAVRAVIPPTCEVCW